jgi:hypothetical protein
MIHLTVLGLQHHTSSSALIPTLHPTSFDEVSAYADQQSCEKTKGPEWSLFRLRDDFRREGSQESSGEHPSFMCVAYQAFPSNVQELSLVLDQLLNRLRFKERFF